MTAGHSLAATVDNFLDRYGFVDCRELGHPWITETHDWFIEGAGAQRVYRKTRRCPVCDTQRVDRVNARFERLHSQYVYPDGYKAEPGVTINRGEVRRWEIQRMLAAEADPPRKTGRRRKGASS
jgi:hypothetical protein